MPQLTVLIPCKNERHNIGPCIESVRALADEILVADSGSTDDTLEVVRKLGGCRIIEREFVGYASFKNWAIPQAKHDWVLALDADERIPAHLAAEIRQVLKDDPPHDAYAVRFLPYFLGHPVRYCGWSNSYCKRLFRRDLCRYSDARVHESLEVPSGKVAKLRGKIDHYTARDIAEFLVKQNRYTTSAAQDAFDQGKRTNFLKLLLKAPIRFLQAYLLQGGFLDGQVGLNICMLTATYSYFKEAKLWGLANERPESDLVPLSPSTIPLSRPQVRRRAA